MSSSRMFVLSDGQETTAPMVADVLPDILELGITIDTIAYRFNHCLLTQY